MPCRFSEPARGTGQVAATPPGTRGAASRPRPKKRLRACGGQACPWASESRPLLFPGAWAAVTPATLKGEPSPRPCLVSESLGAEGFGLSHHPGSSWALVSCPFEGSVHLQQPQAIPLLQSAPKPAWSLPVPSAQPKPEPRGRGCWGIKSSAQSWCPWCGFLPSASSPKGWLTPTASA